MSYQSDILAAAVQSAEARKDVRICELQKALNAAQNELQRVLDSKLLTSDLKVFADLGFPKTAYRIGKALQKAQEKNNARAS